MPATLVSLVIRLALAMASPADAAASAYPPARVDVVADEYHGTRVGDPYRWLEDMRSPETLRWLRAEEGLLERYVARQPVRQATRRRVGELTGEPFFLAPVKAGGKLFLMRAGSGGVSGGLWVQDGPSVSPRPLLDPETRFPGRDASIAGFSPSPDGRLVACAVSEGQSGWLRIHVLETSRGTDLEVAALEANSLSRAIAWMRDGSRFFYTHYGRATGSDEATATPIRPEIRRYSLTDRRDEPIYAPSDPGVLVTESLTEDDRYLVLALHEGSRNENRVSYVDLEATGRAARTLIPDADATYTFLGAKGRVFWFFTDWRAPRGRVIAVDLDRPARESWREVIPEAPDPVAGNSAAGGNALGMFGDRFVLTYLRDGSPRLRVFGLDGRLEYEPELPPGGTIWGGLSGRQSDSEVFYQFLGLTDMGTVYRLDVAKKECKVFHRPRSSADPNRFHVERVFYESSDRTRIPMFVVERRGAVRDGTSPTYLYGYGAFGWVSFLWYQPFVLDWVERGGVYALPALRGGGEYGEPWHAAGAGRNKRRAVADFLAAAEWLVRERYTAPRRLVANGGSASGAIAAAAVLERPDLFGAAVIDRPVLDLVRFDRFTQAAYWVPEYGSPSNAEDFRALLAWSPYHNIRKGRCYPPTLVVTGDRDQVAVPLHAYKFTAALQAAQGCDRPVLLKVIPGAGHNFGTTPDQVADTLADEAAFLERALADRAGGQ